MALNAAVDTFADVDLAADKIALKATNEAYTHATEEFTGALAEVDALFAEHAGEDGSGWRVAGAVDAARATAVAAAYMDAVAELEALESELFEVRWRCGGDCFLPWCSLRIFLIPLPFPPHPEIFVARIHDART